MMKIYLVVGGLIAAAPLCSVLVACGSGGGDDNSVTDPANGRLAGGVEGVQFSSQASYTDPATSKITNSLSSGTTDEGGKFKFALIEPQTCTTDSNGKQSCDWNGAVVYGPVTFSLCDGVALTIPALTSYPFQTPTYTQLDFFTDPNAAQNLATVELMANINQGDPAKTGIKLPSSLQKATCQPLDWSTNNIQKDAASIQTAAKQDGLPHEWPDAQAVSDYVMKMYLCSRSGFYGGTQYNTETPGYPARSMSGNFQAYVDATGRVDGYLDFTNQLGGAPTVGPIPFTGSVSVAPGGVGNVLYISPADAPIPGLNVSISLYPNGALGSWTTADGSLAGSTAFADSAFGPGIGMYDGSAVAIPKYRFLAENLTYTPPGESAPKKYILSLDVGYDNNASGSLYPWPPDPQQPNNSYILSWTGSMSGNSLSLGWFNDPTHASDPSNVGFMLTFDPDTNTLTGVVPGYHDEQFVTFSTDQPLQGCRM